MQWICWSELEFLKSLWWLGTEEEEGYRTGPPGYIGWRNSFLRIDSGAPYTFKNTSSVHSTNHGLSTLSSMYAGRDADQEWSSSLQPLWLAVTICQRGGWPPQRPESWKLYNITVYDTYTLWPAQRTKVKYSTFWQGEVLLLHRSYLRLICKTSWH
jgi:hypothetical protein